MEDKMGFQRFQTFSPQELVDFDKQRDLFEKMLDHSANKRLMFIQGAGMCGKTTLLQFMRFRCEEKNIPWCRIDFRGKSYDGPHWTLAREICRQLGLSPSHMGEEALQIFSNFKPIAVEASINIQGDVTEAKLTTVKIDSVQSSMTVSFNYEELRKPYMWETLTRAFTADLTDFAEKKESVVCIFDSIEDISVEDEEWLLHALLSPITKGQFKGVIVVAAGRRWPKIEPWQWEDHAHMLERLPPMTVEHFKSYAQKVGVKITDKQARDYWRDSGRGNPMMMVLKIRPWNLLKG